MKFIIFWFFSAALLFAQTEESGQVPLATDTPFWRQALGGNILSLPSVQAQSVVVALDGGSIKAYSTGGTELWTYSARGRISPYVSRSREGTSYFSRLNGTLIAVNRAGRELWQRNMGAPLAGKVVPGWDGRLFVPADKKLLCYTAAGTLLWTKEYEHSYLLAPAIDRTGGVIFALQNNEIYRVDAFGNTVTWTVLSPPAVLLSMEQEQIFIVYSEGTLEILGDEQNWFLSAQVDEHANVMPRLPARPLAAVSHGNSIISVLSDGRVVLVSIEERSIIWTSDSHIREIIKTGGRPDLEAEIVYDERGFYVLSKNGASAFTLDGQRQWYTLIENAASIPAFGNDGVLYSGGRDWILYAYKIEDRMLNTRGNLYGQQPGGIYGTGSPQAEYLPRIPVFDDEIQSILSFIQIEITRGNVGENELAWTSFLLTLTAGQQPIQVKVGAIRLLGQIGSRETVPWLVNIFRRDPEPLVRAAAATAIGNIGVDPEGIALLAFLYTLMPENIRDEQILTAITRATGDICRFSGPPLSETGIRILNLLTGSGLPAGVRREAERELATLR